METDAALNIEFAYTSWTQSCRALYSPGQCCRRATGHDGPHASGYGDNRVWWTDDTNPRES